MKRMFSFLALLTLFLLFLFAGSAAAIPTLGVAPTEGGFYYGEYEDYKSVFVDPANFIPFSGDEGFSLPADGGSLTVWAGYQGTPPDWWGATGVEVWLLTNNDFGDDFSFDGEDFKSVSYRRNLSGYGRDFFGVNLGNPADGVTSGWDPAPSGSPFDIENGEFRFNEGIFSFGDGFDPFVNWIIGEDWLFAVAGIFETFSPTQITEVWDKSPRTSSAGYPVPEPATMLLFGTGLIGMAAIGRRKFRKS